MGLAVGVLISSCSTTLPNDERNHSDGQANGLAPARSRVTADQFAQALAVSLNSIKNRRLVRDALQASNLTEHKVHLQAFLASRNASPILGEVANELGLTDETLSAEVSSLGAIDLYMVARQQRTSWTPEAPLIVAAQMGDHPPDHAYNSSGEESSLHLEDHVLPRTALLYLERAEPTQEFRLTRVGGSSFIQDPNEQRLRPASQQCDPEVDPGCEEGGGGGGGGSPLCSNYKLKGLATYHLYDNNNPFEGNEIEVRGTASQSSGVARVTGVDPTTSINLDAEILCTSDSPDQIVYYVVETDGFPNPDDFFTLPYPNGSKHFSIGLQDYGYPILVYSWPSELDSSVYYWKISIKVDL